MENKKGQTVTLILRGDESKTREFTVSEAEDLFKLQSQQSRSEWGLPKKSNFELTENGKLTKRADSKPVQSSEK